MDEARIGRAAQRTEVALRVLETAGDELQSDEELAEDELLQRFEITAAQAAELSELVQAKRTRAESSGAASSSGDPTFSARRGRWRSVRL